MNIRTTTKKTNRLTQTENKPVVTSGRRKGEEQNMGGGLELQPIIYIYILKSYRIYCIAQGI